MLIFKRPDSPEYPTCFDFSLFALDEAFPAVNGLIIAGLKWYFSLFAAACAANRIHLARAPAGETAALTTLLLISARGTAGRTALGFVGETFGREERLLLGRELEGFSAIGTNQSFF